MSRNIVYRVDYQAIGGLIGYLVQNCCQGNEAVLACCQMPSDCC